MGPGPPEGLSKHLRHLRTTAHFAEGKQISSGPGPFPSSPSLMWRLGRGAGQCSGPAYLHV